MTGTKTPFPYKTEPFGPYQRDILRASAAREYAYLGMEQGTGKTWVTANTAVYLWLKGKIDAMVVLAPNGVHTAWALEQLPAHMSDAVPWRALVWRSETQRALWHKRQKTGTVAARREDWEVFQMASDRTIFPILCVNSEALGVDLARKAIGTFLSMRRCLLVADEAGDFTTPSAVRTRFLLSCRGRAPYRRVLEGVPIGTEPFELYAPFRFLHPSILGYRRYSDMKEAHAEWRTIVKGSGEKAREIKVVATNSDGSKKWLRLDYLAERIAPHMFRVTKAEALPFLPPKQFHKRFFTMTAEQWRLTNELRETLIATMQSGEVATVQNVLTLYLRFQQIACGYLPPDIEFGEEQEPISVLPGPNPRLEACVDELLSYAGRQTIIWTRFKFDIDILADRLRAEGISCVTYDGRTAPGDRERAKAAFMAGHVQVFLGNSAAGGRGLNLQAAQHEIFYANYFGLRRRLQAEDRGHRIGSSTTEPVTICDLVGDYSIDTMIVRALRNNKNVADEITGDPAMEWI
jgi:hypothetical protein